MVNTEVKEVGKMSNIEMAIRAFLLVGIIAGNLYIIFGGG
jgi:hypothetical protein